MKDLRFLLPMGIWLVATCLFTATPNAYADVQCGQWVMTPYGAAQHCEAGIPSTDLDVTASQQQRMTEWCWAASIAGVFSYYGHPIDQTEVVQQAYGSIVNWPGTPLAIIQSLNRAWTDDKGNTFRSSATYYSTWPLAAQDLVQKEPLIIGSLGHAMIVTAIDYDRLQNGIGGVTAVTVRDPWPLNPQRRLLSQQEFNGTQMLIRIRVH